MAELSADIVLRTKQVDQKLKDTGRKFRGFGSDIGKAMAAANAVLDDVPPKLDNVNKKVRNSSIIWFQAGQAISDFAAAGILGAANNIEFLAAQMGIGGPLIAGIAVATTAFIVFKEDISRALNPVGEQVKDLKEGLEEIFEVLGGPGSSISIGLFADQLGAALEEQKKKVDNLRSALFALQFGIETEQSKAIAEQFKTVGNLNAALAQERALLEKIEAEWEKITKAADAFAAGQQNALIAQNDLAGQLIRQGIEALGLQKELGNTTNIRLVELAREGELEEFITKLQEKKTRGKREELTEFEKAVKVNERLKERLEALRNIDDSRLGTLLQQNKALEEQIKVVQRLNAAGGFGGLGISAQGLVPAGLDTTPQPIGELIEDLKKSEAQRQKSLLAPRLLDPRDVEELENAADRYIEASRRMVEANERLASSIEDGIGGAIGSLASSIGSGENLFNSLRSSIGTFAVQVGETLIGFGTAGIALQTFITNPVGAIVAGSALVALGSALKSSVSSQSESFATTGAVSSPPGRIDPRQGRRFQRGFEPLPPESLLDKLNSINWSMVLRGEDLIASADATTRRQNRTREVANSSLRSSGR